MTSLVEPPAFRVPDPPEPPRYDLWPVALRSAGRLRGTLVPCGPGLRGIGWPETPTVRAAALAEFLTDGRIATLMTAAWVWGAAKEPGRPIRASTVGGRRKLAADNEMLRTMEIRYTDADIARLGRFGVTGPKRTVVDLLHTSEEFGIAERVACRLLARSFAGGLAGIQAHLSTHRRPHRSRACSRLAGMLAPPELEHSTATTRSRLRTQ